MQNSTAQAQPEFLKEKKKRTEETTIVFKTLPVFLLYITDFLDLPYTHSFGVPKDYTYKSI